MIRNENPICIPDGMKAVMKKLKELDCEVYAFDSAVRELINGGEPEEIELACSLNCNAVEDALDGAVSHVDTKHFDIVMYIDADGRRYIIHSLIDGQPLNGVSLGFNSEFFKYLFEEVLTLGFKCDNLLLDSDGYVCDRYSGLKDTISRKVTTILPPEKAFEKKPVLILGALELMVYRGYTIDAELKSAMFKKAYKLTELTQSFLSVMIPCLFAGNHTAEMLDEYFDIFAVCIPELMLLKNCPQNSPYHDYDVYGHTIECIRQIERLYDTDDWALKLVGLFHDIGKSSVRTTDVNGVDHFYNHASRSALICESVLKRWGLQESYIETIVNIVLYHDIELKPNEQRVMHQYRKYGKSVYRGIVNFRVCDLSAQNVDLIEDRLDKRSDVVAILDNIKYQDDTIMTTNDLDISGHVLKELGLQGKQIGDMKIALLNKVIDKEVINDENELRALAYILMNTGEYMDSEIK